MQLKKYLDTYQNILEHSYGNVPDFIRSEQEMAKSFLEKHGLPDNKDERYNNMDFSSVFEGNDFDKIITSPDLKVDLNAYFQCDVNEMDTDLILLSNGWYHRDSLSDNHDKSGLIVCGMKEAILRYPEIVKKHFNKYLKESEDGWAYLNTLLAHDGVFVYVPDNFIPKKALQIVNLTHGFNKKEIFQRNLIVLGENAQLQLVLCDHTLNKAENLNHIGTEFFMDKNSNLELYILQNEPDVSNVFNHMSFYQSEGSSLRSVDFSLHGGTIRNNLYVKLAGEHAESQLYGLQLSDRQQKMDNFTFIEHAVPNCSSNEFYRSILDEESRGNFCGKIFVCKDAQKTKAFQTNNSICLTDTAKMRAKPQLEIYADDVQCSHGATVGQLDEEAMFYLRSRGIDKKEARFMMMFAFANEIVAKINIEPLRERVAGLVSQRLRGELAGCEHCLLNCNVKID
jgi:Fe-S cluster assembly protein SufD